MFFICRLSFFLLVLGGKAGCGPIESSRKGTEAKIFSLPEFVHIAGIDNYNLYKLLDFCQRSKIAHKVCVFHSFMNNSAR